MLKKERQNYILELLKKEGIIRISDMVPKIAGSMMTVRRDLDELEEKGLLNRIHGGAILAKEDKSDVFQPSFQHRMEEHQKEKLRISAAAAEMISPGDIVFLDAGTTTYLILDHIDTNLNFTCITPGMFTATRAAMFPNASIISIGGYLHKSSYSSIGTAAVESIKKYHANKAFISTKAFNFPLGCYEADMHLIEIKRAIVQSADKIILLADYSKFNSESLSPSVALSEINTIITDKQIDTNILTKIQRANIKTLLV